MSEFLTVRLSRNEQAPIRWLVWSKSENEIIASGEISDPEQLGELSGYASQRTTILLLDSRDVSILEAQVPVGAARQIESMLPYLLEDEIAQDVEELHFSILNKERSSIRVAITDKSYLAYVLALFSKVNITVQKILPDAEALPLLDGAISAIQVDTQWLFRKGLHDSITVEEKWLKHFLGSDWWPSSHSGMTEKSDISEIHSFTGKPKELDNDPRLTDKLHWVSKEPELVMEMLTRGAIVSPVNILSGDFKPKSSFASGLKIWKKSAIAAVLFVLIFALHGFLQIQNREAQALAYREESERIFRTIFPNKKRIPTVSYLKGQMTTEENLLSNGGGDSSMLFWLSRLSIALKTYPSIEIASIRFDANRNELRLEASMADFQTFEKVRIKLAEQYDVVQGPLDRSENRVSGSFVLRSKP